MIVVTKYICRHVRTILPTILKMLLLTMKMLSKRCTHHLWKEGKISVNLQVTKYFIGNWLAFRYCTTRRHLVWNIGCVYAMGLKTLLNRCFQLNVEESHNWLQSIQYILCSNVFGNILANPPDVGQFHKVFKTRLKDQFIQDWQSAISSFSRFSNRRELSVAFQLPVYKNALWNPYIRLIYTRLRTDLNALSTCRARKKQSRMCSMSNTELKTVSHFVLHCPYFSVERNNLYDCINPYSP